MDAMNVRMQNVFRTPWKSERISAAFECSATKGCFLHVQSIATPFSSWTLALTDLLVTRSRAKSLSWYACSCCMSIVDLTSAMPFSKWHLSGVFL